MDSLRPLLAAAALALTLAGVSAASAQMAAPARPVALADAVRLGLVNNLDLSIQRLEPLISRQQIREAAGEFDPIAMLTLSYARTERPIVSSLEQQATSGIIVDRTLTPDSALLGRAITGAQYSLTFNTPWVVDTTNPLRLYDQYYQPVINFGLTQPLLRDFGIETNLVKMRKAEKSERQALSTVEAGMLAVIRDVESRYWALYHAQQHVGVAEGGLELARDLVVRLERMVKAGLATDLDLLEARAAVDARRGDVAAAQAALIQARAQLKLLVDPKGELATALEATEEPPFIGAPDDLAGKLGRALARRPEIRAQELAVERLALDEHQAKNATQWRVDAIGNLGWNGLAGSPPGPNVRNLPTRLQGQDTYWDSFRGFFSPDGYVSWSLGVRVVMPIGNREAEARLEQSRLRRRQEELRLALVRSQVTTEVEAAFQEMTAESVRYAAAREGVGLAREQLSARERELGSGLATVRRVLEAQDALALAQDRQSLALVAYSTARARLDAAYAISTETYRLALDH